MQSFFCMDVLSEEIFLGKEASFLQNSPSTETSTATLCEIEFVMKFDKCAKMPTSVQERAAVSQMTD